MSTMANIMRLTCVTACIGYPGGIVASTIFSTLLPGNQYFCCSGYNFASDTPLAAAFTPTQFYKLNQIDVAVWNGVPQPFTVILAQDSGGEPGAAIESWSLADISPPPSGFVTFGPSTAVSVLDTLSITLMPNVQYWVEVTSPVGAFWNVNNLGPGPQDTIAAFNAGSWHVLNAFSEPPAFDVLGTVVPEPSFAIPVGLVFLGFLGARLIQRSPRSPGVLSALPQAGCLPRKIYSQGRDCPCRPREE